MMLVGRPAGEAALLALAAQLEQAQPWARAAAADLVTDRGFDGPVRARYRCPMTKAAS